MNILTTITVLLTTFVIPTQILLSNELVEWGRGSYGKPKVTEWGEGATLNFMKYPFF